MSQESNNTPVPESFLPREPAQQIWDLRVMGADVFEIAQKLGSSVEEVSRLLAGHHQARVAQPTEAKSFYRDLAISRCDALLKVYLPISLMDEVVVEKIRSGEPIRVESIDHPLACAALVVGILKFQAELLGLKIRDETAESMDPRALLDWLQSQVTAIEKVVAEAPRDIDVEGVQLPAGCFGGLELQNDHDIDRFEQAEPDLEIAFDLPSAASVAPSPKAQIDQREERRRRWLNGQHDGL